MDFFWVGITSVLCLINIVCLYYSVVSSLLLLSIAGMATREDTDMTSSGIEDWPVESPIDDSDADPDYHPPGRSPTTESDDLGNDGDVEDPGMIGVECKKTIRLKQKTEADNRFRAKRSEFPFKFSELKFYT